MLAVESSNTGCGMGEAAGHCRSATTANLLRNFSIGGIRPAAPTTYWQLQKIQIPPDLVVKCQAIDIAEVIL
jgi:hypothetical protein